MENIVIFGSAFHAKVVIDIVEKENKYKIGGLIDKDPKQNGTILGYPVLGADEDLPRLVKKHNITGGVVAIGDNFLRAAIVEKIKKISPALSFIKAIHPSAVVARDVQIGAGTVLMAGAVVNPCSAISEHCIVNTNASLDHDGIMESFSSLGPRVVTGGNVKIRSHAAVSIGATLIEGIEIGEHTVIGAGATVLKNVESHKLAYGTPNKVIRTRKAGDKYLS